MLRHCCLTVWAAAKVVEALSASRALGVPELNNKSATENTKTTGNDGLLHFMVQPLKLKNDSNSTNNGPDDIWIAAGFQRHLFGRQHLRPTSQTKPSG